MKKGGGFPGLESPFSLGSVGRFAGEALKSTFVQVDVDSATIG